MSSKHQPSSSSTRRKSSFKRLLVHSDDDDDDDDNDDNDGIDAPVTQRSKRPRTDPPPSIPTTPGDEDNMDVDLDTLRDSAQRSLSADDDSRFLPEAPPVGGVSPVRADTSKRRSKSTVVVASTKKRPRALHSDDEASNSHVECNSVDDPLSDLASPLSEISDDVEPDTPSKHGAPKAKINTAKDKPGKARSTQPKGATIKGLKDKERDREIVMKDERKLAVLPATTSRASSAAAQSQPSDLFANDDPAPSSAVDPQPDAAKDVLSQTIPKKRKLPPIKKTKTATGGTGTLTPTSTTQKPAPPPVQELAKPSLPTSEQRKQALTGVRDVDLGDSKIYAELFKGAGGNTPKSGLKNAEERRKELDRMRDEARARRVEEMKYTFDLQSQADKIARFEQRLRAENSTVLHPNFLAAKFRDEWEMEKRHRRAVPKEEGEA